MDVTAKTCVVLRCGMEMISDMKAEILTGAEIVFVFKFCFEMKRQCRGCCLSKNVSGYATSRCSQLQCPRSPVVGVVILCFSVSK